MRQVVTQRTNRHERGWGGRTRTTHVPLLSSGERKRGFFRVPASFAGVTEHTNLQHQANQYRNQKVLDWVEFQRRNGWRLLDIPVVTDPILSPSFTTDAEPIDGEAMRVYVEATFVRELPMKMPLDLFLHKQEQAQRYGESLNHALIENPLPRPVDHIADGVVENPMEQAAQRRDQLGLRRELIVEDGEVTGAEVIYETPPTGSLDRDQGVN